MTPRIAAASIRLLSLAVALVPAAALQAQDRVFFGNLHSHTSYSDGSGTPEEAYRYAREVARLHFLAITEHNHAGAEIGAGALADGIIIARRPELYNGSPESVVAAANRMTENGRFVALYGQEFSTISTGNHVNVFGIDTVIPVPNGYFFALTRWLEQRLDEHGLLPVVQFNHPALHRDTTNAYGADDFRTRERWIANMGRFASLISVLNGPSKTQGSGSRPQSQESHYRAYLNRGFRLGPTADQDNHYRTWGTATDGRTGVVAPSLTRRDIMHALRNRHVFATEDPNLEVILRVEGHLMGSVVDTAPAGETLDVRVTLRDGDEPHARYEVQVFSDDAPGGAQARRVNTFTVHGNVENHALPGVRYTGPGQYLYLHVRQTTPGAQTDRAWTAPVWFQ